MLTISYQSSSYEPIEPFDLESCTNQYEIQVFYTNDESEVFEEPILIGKGSVYLLLIAKAMNTGCPIYDMLDNINYEELFHIAFLDADDWYNTNRFEYEKRIFESDNSIDGTYGISKTEFKNPKLKEEYLKIGRPEYTKITKDIKPEELYKSFVEANYGFFQTDTITIKKTALIKAGLFDIRFPVMQDTQLFLKLSFSNKITSNNNPDPIAYRYIHGDNSILKSNPLRVKLFPLLMTSCFEYLIKLKKYDYNFKNEYFNKYISKYYKGDSLNEKFKNFIKENKHNIITKFAILKIIHKIKYKNDGA